MTRLGTAPSLESRGRRDGTSLADAGSHGSDCSSLEASAPLCKCGKQMRAANASETSIWMCCAGGPCNEDVAWACSAKCRGYGLCNEHGASRPSPSESGPVPWPEVTVGSKWDVYVDGVFERTQAVRSPQAEMYSRDGYLSSDGRRWTVVPHGWDYATKRPKPGTSTQGTASVGAKSEPTPTAPAEEAKAPLPPLRREVSGDGKHWLPYEQLHDPDPFESYRFWRLVEDDGLVVTRSRFAAHMVSDGLKARAMEQFGHAKAAPEPWRPSDPDGDIANVWE